MKIIKLTAILLVCAFLTAFISETAFTSEKTHVGGDFTDAPKQESADYSSFASSQAIGGIDGGKISAGSAILCADNGLVIFEKQADVPLPMASITKVMSCVVALENADDLAKKVKIPKEAVGIEGSSVYLQEGEEVTLEMLLYSAMLESANDAVTALAILVKGSEAEFVKAMNEKAKELSMVSTNFVNPHGLHDDRHYTTARDYAKLMAYALKNEEFCKIISTKKMYYPSSDGSLTRVLVNHNKLLSSYGGMIGGKTGYTKTSGRTLVTAARRDGTVLICVTINAGSDWQDHTYLFNKGFETVETRTYEKGSAIAAVPIAAGKETSAELILENDVRITVPRGKEITVRCKSPHFVFAPIEADKAVGEAVFYVDGSEVAKTALRTEKSVQAAETAEMGIIEKIKVLINGRNKNT